VAWPIRPDFVTPRVDCSFEYHPPCQVAPDGRFIVLKKNEQEAEAANPRQINLVLDWFEELKRLCPPAK